ncbi:hypothetical protein ES708_16496 [subsurface metagenome]
MRIGRTTSSIPSNGGDMYKSVYAPDKDGLIAEAQLLLNHPTHKVYELTKAFVEAVLTGEITSHTHPAVNGGGDGANIKSRAIRVETGDTVDVEFTTPFVTSIPHVVVTPAFFNTSGSASWYVFSITLSGFRIKGASNPNGDVNWIATNAGNL